MTPTMRNYPRETLEPEINRIVEMLDEGFKNSPLQWSEYCDMVMAAAAHHRNLFPPLSFSKPREGLTK